jgi:hypothetical protein
MQTLQLADDLFEGVWDGSKTLTILNGRHEIALGDLLFEGTTDTVVFSAIVDVWAIIYTKLGDLFNEDARLDGAETAEDLAANMKRFYPDIGPDSEITIVKFFYTNWEA